MKSPFWFLDFDGVLNRHKRQDNGYCTLDKDKIRIVNGVLRDTGAKIVVASAWRYMVLRGSMTLEGFNNMLATYGMEGYPVVGVIDPEPMLRPDRGELCLKWMRDNFGYGIVCATDDLDLGYSGKLPFVQTDGEVGITEADAAQVRTIFERGKCRWPTRANL